MVIICETGFETEDKNNLGYSMLELDFYMFNPERIRRPELDHRLTMRKNLKSNKYELYRFYFSSKRLETIFVSNNLQDVLNKANIQCNKVHKLFENDPRQPDLACNHESSQLDSFHCRYYKEKSERDKVIS